LCLGRKRKEGKGYGYYQISLRVKSSSRKMLYSSNETDDEHYPIRAKKGAEKSGATPILRRRNEKIEAQLPLQTKRSPPFNEEGKNNSITSPGERHVPRPTLKKRDNRNVLTSPTTSRREEESHRRYPPRKGEKHLEKKTVPLHGNEKKTPLPKGEKKPLKLFLPKSPRRRNSDIFLEEKKAIQEKGSQKSSKS